MRGQRLCIPIAATAAPDTKYPGFCFDLWEDLKHMAISVFASVSRSRVAVLNAEVNGNSW
jgi:hypothetical protein